MSSITQGNLPKRRRRHAAALLTSLALCAGAPALAAQGGGTGSGGGSGQQVRVQVRTLPPEEVERLQRQLDRIMHTLATEQQGMDAETMRRVRVQLEQTLRALEASRLAMEAQAAREARVAERSAMVEMRRGMVAPRMETVGAAQNGWLGLWLSTSAEIVGERDGTRLWRFHGYPMVDAVDPGSPASRAGIESGDVVVALAGKDLKKGPLPLDALLTPGKRLTVRLTRDGRVKHTTLTVARRPQRMVLMSPEAPRAMTMPRGVEPALPPTPPTPGAAPVQGRAPRARVAITAPPTPPAFGFWTGSTGLAGIAGAEVTRLRDGMEDYFGVGAGLLVLRVPDGTPASEAGLRPGDVIVAARGEDVEAPQELRDAIAASGESRTLPLEVVRKQKRIKLTLRW